MTCVQGDESRSKGGFQCSGLLLLWPKAAQVQNPPGMFQPFGLPLPAATCRLVLKGPYRNLGVGGGNRGDLGGETLLFLAYLFLNVPE